MYPVFAAVEQRHWWFVGRQKIFLTALRKYIRTDKNRVLDVGCGTGGMLPLLQHFGEVTGTDVDVQAVHFARQRKYITVDVADAQKLPYQDNSFDLVSAVDLIEHLENEQLLMDELVRVTRPGGYVFITSAALPWLWSPLDIFSKHYRRYTKRNFQKATRHGHLEALSIRYYNVIFFLPVAIIRLLQRLWPKQPTSADHLTELRVPPTPVNITAREIFQLERFFLPIPFPFGVSIFGMYRKIPK